MSRPLKVLLLEDRPEDTELLLRELRRAGYVPEWKRVDTEGDYLKQLHAGLDLILSDYEMPQFSGLRALDLLKERKLEIPFIIVSGTIGEETAVEAMKLGAADYLMKDRLGRLGPAIAHALVQARLHQERKVAVHALGESEGRFRQVVENIQEVFWIRDLGRNNITYVSPGYETIWGRPAADLYLAPQGWLETVHIDDRERMRQLARSRHPFSSFDETYRIVRPDGTERWIRDKAFPVIVDGKVVKVVGVAEDVTEHKHLEAQFLHAQRMEAIGTLAGGVAHDLNNILTPVTIVASLLRDSTTSPRELEFLDMIQTSAQRGAAIIRQLLAFSRGVGGEKIILQPRHLIKEMAAIAEETFPRNISVSNEVSADLDSVVADPTQLHQVLMNLCVNARDAMPDGGRLIIRAGNRRLSEDDARADPQMKAGEYVVISIADTGEGIRPEIITRIFDPFFTTKPVGKGTGLGLSTVLGIVRSHGGFVIANSKIGEGTCFDVFIPAERKNAEHVVEEAPQVPTSPGRGQLILVIDDETQIRESVRELLERAGYRVITANNGEEGVSLFTSHADQIRLVVTDLMMPVMDGVRLAQVIRTIHEGIKIIAVSGLEDKERVAKLTALGVTDVLAKPYSSRALLDMIERSIVFTPGN